MVFLVRPDLLDLPVFQVNQEGLGKKDRKDCQVQVEFWDQVDHQAFPVVQDALAQKAIEEMVLVFRALKVIKATLVSQDLRGFQD